MGIYVSCVVLLLRHLFFPPHLSGKSELAQLALHNPHIWATEQKTELP